MISCYMKLLHFKMWTGVQKVQKKIYYNKGRKSIDRKSTNFIVVRVLRKHNAKSDTLINTNHKQVDLQVN